MISVGDLVIVSGPFVGPDASEGEPYKGLLGKVVRINDNNYKYPINIQFVNAPHNVSGLESFSESELEVVFVT